MSVGRTFAAVLVAGITALLIAGSLALGGAYAWTRVFPDAKDMSPEKQAAYAAENDRLLATLPLPAHKADVSPVSLPYRNGPDGQGVIVGVDGGYTLEFTEPVDQESLLLELSGDLTAAGWSVQPVLSTAAAYAGHEVPGLVHELKATKQDATTEFVTDPGAPGELSVRVDHDANGKKPKFEVVS